MIKRCEAFVPRRLDIFILFAPSLVGVCRVGVHPPQVVPQPHPRLLGVRDHEAHAGHVVAQAGAEGVVLTPAKAAHLRKQMGIRRSVTIASLVS